jgi:hypothetical protein
MIEQSFNQVKRYVKKWGRNPMYQGRIETCIYDGMDEISEENARGYFRSAGWKVEDVEEAEEAEDLAAVAVALGW